MNAARRTGRRTLGAASVVVLGGALSVSIWVSGSHAWAVGAFVALCAVAAATFWWAGGTGDVAAILRSDGDERQGALDRDALAITSLLVVAAALVGSIVAVARTGNPGDFGVICVVFGVGYVVSLITLRWRG